MNYDMNTYPAYNNFETYGGSAGEQQYTGVNQAPGAYPWNASASAPVASQSTPEQPSQPYDYNYGYGNYSGGYQDYSEGYDYGYDGSYDQWNATTSNTTITSSAKPPQRGGYTPAERGGYSQSVAPKRGGYAPAEVPQRGGFAQSAAPETGGYAQSDSSQPGGYAQPPPPQRGGFTQPPPVQRGGYIQPPPPQRGGYTQPPPPQRGGFIQPPPSQRGGYTQPPPSLLGGYTQPPPSQIGGYTQPPPPQRGGYAQSGAPQESDYTPETTAQRGGYTQTQGYEYAGPAGDNGAYAGGNVQGEAPFGRGRGVAGMRGGGRGMGAGRATIGEQNWGNDGDNAKPWNVGRGGFNNIGYEAKKPFGFGSGNRGRGRGGMQAETAHSNTGFGHFANNRVPMNQESLNASSTTQALISRWKTFTRGFTDCGNAISNLECSLKASKINILQLHFDCKFLSKCNTYSIFTGVLHINKIVDNNVTESLFIARGVGLSKKSAKMDCYEKAYNLLLNCNVQNIVTQKDYGEAKLSQDVQTLYKENPEEFSELLKKSIALIEVVVPKASVTPINSGQGANRGRGHTGNQGISRGGTQAMGRGGVGVSRGGLGIGRGAGQAMGRGGPGLGRGGGQAMGRGGGLGMGRGGGLGTGRGGSQRGGRGGSQGVGRGGSLGTSGAVNKVAGRGGIQAGSRGGSIAGKKRASNTTLSDVDAKRPRFSLAPTKTVGILMNPADPLIDKLAKLKELLKEEGITKLHIVPKVDQIAHKTAINIKNIYRFQDVPILGFESKMPVYCEVYFDDVFMADGIADFKRNVAMQDAYNNLATALYSQPLEAIVSCSRIWQPFMCSDPDVCNVVTKWQGEDNNSLLTSNLTNMKQMMQSMPDVTIPIEKMVLTEHESDKDIQNIFKALELSATRNLMLLECEIVRNPDLKFTCSISLQGRLLASRTHGTKNGAKRVCSEAVMNELKKNNDYIFVATEYIGKKITNQELVLEAAKKKALGEPPAKVFFKKSEHKDGENAKQDVADATKPDLENKTDTEEMKALVPWMAAVMYDIIDDYYQKITLEDLMVNVTDMTKIQRDVVNACASKMGLRVITKLKTHTDSSLLRRTVTAQDMCKMLQLHGGQSGRYKLVTCKNKLSEVEKEKFRAECLQQHQKLVDARTNDDPDAQPTEPTPAPIKSTVRPAAKTAPAPKTGTAPKIRPGSTYRPFRPQSRPAFRAPHHMQAFNRPMPLMSSHLHYGPPRMPRFPFPRF